MGKGIENILAHLYGEQAVATQKVRYEKAVAVFGDGVCYILSIRPAGGLRIL